MKKTSTLCAAVIGATLLSAPIAHANDEIPRSPIEVTLFGGYSMGKSLATIDGGTAGATSNLSVHTDHARLEKGAAYSLALNWEAEANAYYEISYSKQSTKLAFTNITTDSNTSTSTSATSEHDASIEYFQVGGYITFTDEQARVVPYFLLTIGAARFSPDGPGLQDSTKFAAAVGGGMKVVFTKHLALRLDARAYATFFQSEKEVFCETPGTGCSVHLDGETVIQPQASLGLTVGF